MLAVVTATAPTTVTTTTMPPPAALMSLAKFYNSNFDRRPVKTLIVTNGVLNSIADCIAQTSQIVLANPGTPHPHTPEFEPPPPSYDLMRTARFAAFGMFMGPIIGQWMRILEKTLPMRAGNSKSGFQIAKRVLADQAIMAPIGLVLFVSSMGLMERRTKSEIKEKFSDMYMPALLANWKVWPLAQAVNFTLMPIQYRVPFQSTCGIAWTTYLSLLAARDVKHLDGEA